MPIPFSLISIVPIYIISHRIFLFAMTNKLKLLSIFFVLFFSFGCGNSTSPVEKSHGDKLVIGDAGSSTIIDPILVSSGISAGLIHTIFDGLVRIDEKMKAQPHVATSWEVSPDGLRYTFRLRKEVKFHDGAELTSEDVKFTLDKIREVKGSPYRNSFQLVENVVVRDKYTVELILKAPNASLPFALDVGILPRHVTSNHIVGTGAFKLISQSPKEIILEANEDYFLGKPCLNEIVIKIFENQQIAWARLLRGDVDFIPEVPLEQCRLTTEMSSFKVHSFLAPYYYILAFNLNDDLFKDKRARQALNFGINKQGIITKILDGKGQVAPGTIYPQSWPYNSEVEPYPYDPKKASRLLEEAGWKDTDGDHIIDKDRKPFQFVLYLYSGDEIAERCALLIQDQVRDMGIQMDVKILPIETINKEYLFPKRFQAVFLYIVSDDPDKNYQFWHSSQIEGGFNVFSYKNSNVDALLDKGRETLDWQKRKRIYYQLQKEMREDPPGIFLFWRQYFVAMDKRFRGVKINPARILSNIHEWYVPKEEQKYK